MNPEQNRRQCAVCEESEPSFIHTVSNSGVFRRLCTDCLLREHREIFCPVCVDLFNGCLPPDDGITCVNCPSIAHRSCSPPPSSFAASSSSVTSFTCPTCSDPNFSFFPKSHVPSSGNGTDGSGTLLDEKSAKALVAASKIAVVSMTDAAAMLKEEAVKKILDAKMAKMRAKDALGNLQDIVLRQKDSENSNPNKRKNSDR
ncbi:unnamed protein product [Microthlaspi erraticum]|uniref:Uncharacterized protein n=1 Tax=Microthlaspi erraticum TaxID=1685480 RepID=A0A6D2KG30_9BRAS|nr:unnamed protein product [Microthlaspi erraticum]